MTGNWKLEIMTRNTFMGAFKAPPLHIISGRYIFMASFKTAGERQLAEVNCTSMGYRRVQKTVQQLRTLHKNDAR